MKKISFAVISLILTICLFSCISNKSSSSDIPSDTNIRSIPKTTSVSTDSNAMAALNQGTQYMDEGKYEEAETFFREAVSIDPDYVDALDYLGMVLRRQGKTDEAIAFLSKSVERDPINVAAYNSLAIAYYDKGNINKAIMICDEAIKNIPEGADGYYQKGYFLMKQKKYKNAIKYFEIAIDMYAATDEEQYGDTAFNLGYCYYSLKEFDKAAGFFEIAYGIFPDDTVVRKYYLESLL